MARLCTTDGNEMGLVSGALNHASIIDGARLAGAPTTVVPHVDVDAVITAVARHREAGRRPVIVTDSIFSMDGDAAPVAALAGRRRGRGAVDRRRRARRVRSHTGRRPRLRRARRGNPVQVAGQPGGFVAGPRSLIDWIRNTARSFVFTTAPTPSAVGAASAALGVLCSGEGADLVDRLRTHVKWLSPRSPSAVVPLVVGTSTAALALSEALESRGLLIPAIRPPSVPVGTARLRIALSAAHAPEDVTRLRVALDELGVAP
ncbi:MAG: aminotransferase class I/II-fold pyridoxal phosphate-dependent enzyme [Microthrixaceae bacterium]